MIKIGKGDIELKGSKHEIFGELLILGKLVSDKKHVDKKFMDAIFIGFLENMTEREIVEYFAGVSVRNDRVNAIMKSMLNGTMSAVLKDLLKDYEGI